MERTQGNRCASQVYAPPVSKRFAAGLVSVVAIALAGGCANDTGDGGDSAADRRQADKDQREHDREIDARVCADNFEDLQSKLEELDSRLSVGLSYDEYTTQLGDVRVEYDQTDFAGSGDLRCLRQVGVKLEKAMNTYAAAANAWRACIDDYACENDSVQPELQRKWGKATTLIEQAAAAGP